MAAKPRTSEATRIRLMVRAATGALAALGLATALVAATPAHASAFEFPAGAAPQYPAGDGMTVGAHVACDYANDRMLVQVGARMTGSVELGRWVRHAVFVREVGQAGWTLVLTYGPWGFAQTKVTVTDVTYVDPNVDLGLDVVPTTKGHAYEVLVYVEHWTGVATPVVVMPTYTEPHDGTINSYILGQGYCLMR